MLLSYALETRGSPVGAALHHRSTGGASYRRTPVRLGMEGTAASAAGSDKLIVERKICGLSDNT